MKNIPAFKLTFLVISIIFLGFPLHCVFGADSNPLAMFTSRYFAGSRICALCHSNLSDIKRNDVSIDSDWRSTMMASSARDPFWHAKVQSEITRTPALKGFIEKKCATCHMPMAYKSAVFENEKTLIFNSGFNSGFINPLNTYHTMAMDGVSCTVCHQIMDDGKLGTKESFSGNFTIDSKTSKPNRKIYGPFDNPLAMPMERTSGFKPVYSETIKKSQLCAVCHTLYTPTVDKNNNIVGEIPEQVAYLEWENSVYGDGIGNNDKSCQDCHMPRAEGGVKISNRPPMILERAPFAKHYFVGGNLFMLNILKDNISELSLTAEEKHFNKTITRTEEMLDSAAEIKIDKITRNKGTLLINLIIKNKTGHKLPTGYPSRRIWAHLLVKDADNKIVFESGAVNKNGKITGNDADNDPEKLEPHYNIIDSKDKVQIYEAIMEDPDGNITYTLLRGKKYIKDNRLLPEGFDKEKANVDIRVIGKALNDEDFSGGIDILTYKVKIDSFKGPFTIKAELLYQAISYRFYRDLITDDNVEYISRFKDIYENYNNNAGIIIGKDEVKVK